MAPSLRRIGSLPRRVAARLRERRKDRRSLERRRRKADAAYACLKRATGRPDLDAATSRRIREYAAEVLGSPDFQPFLRLYSLYRGRFLEGWIPEDFFSTRVIPGLYAGRDPIHEKRTLSRRLLASDAFPDVAYFVDGRWFTPDYEPIAPGELLDRVFAEGGEVYLKQEGSYQGRHVARVDRAGFAKAASALAENSVVQRPIVPHPWFDEINPRAVNTLRLLTSRLRDGGPRMDAACMRIAMGATTHVMSHRMLKVMVVDTDGRLAPTGTDETWQPHGTHPDTGFVFEGARVPFYGAAVELCLRLHARLPHDPLIGWDVAVTEAGRVEIMEWNSGQVGITYSEAAAGPLFADCGLQRFAGFVPGAAR